MDQGGRVQVSVSRPIAAPAARIFRVLADPANHLALDGSDMLRGVPADVPGADVPGDDVPGDDVPGAGLGAVPGTVSGTAPGSSVLRGAGDTFAMAMYLPEIGDYVMLNRITEFEQDRRISWEPTPGDAVACRTARLPAGTPQGYTWSFRLQPDGDTTIVTEMFDCTEAAQVIRDAVADGQDWVPVMHRTLERLAAIVERPGER
jgi:hypothetical protein